MLNSKLLGLFVVFIIQPLKLQESALQLGGGVVLALLAGFH